MRVLRLSMQFAAFIMLFFFLACASPSTKFPAVWKDKTYHGHPEKILVINGFKNPANRKLFEDEFVEALKERGVDAVVSYTIMPVPIVPDKESIANEEALLRRIRDVGADTVLISKPVGKTMGHQSDAYYSELYMNIVTQTDVYDIKSSRLVLSVTAETRQQDIPPSETKQHESTSDRIKTYIKDLVQKLSQQGLF